MIKRFNHSIANWMFRYAIRSGGVRMRQGEILHLRISLLNDGMISRPCIPSDASLATEVKLHNDIEFTRFERFE